MSTNNLKQQWEVLQKENPKLRIRNAAEQLGVSEVELLATKIGETVTRLKNEPKSILKDLKPLKKVMALTRNENCVHERKGIYKNHKIKDDHSIGVFVTKDIDLRIFFDHWASAFAVEENIGENKIRRSIQFFSKDGLAIHKVYLIKDSIVEAFDDLVTKYKSDDQKPTQEVFEVDEKEDYKKDEEIDIDAFHKAWKAMKHTHDFAGVLKDHQLKRVQALQLAPSEYYAKKISKDSIVTMLEKISEKEIPIMVFAGNKGMIQIHTGKINKLMWYDKWYNVLDPDFNMHLNMDGIQSAWVVRKPTDYGVIPSIEVFDKNGKVIVQFFGKRRSAEDQMEKWNKVVDVLE